MAWIWVMIVFLLVRENNDSFGYFIVVALILIQVAMVYQYWSYANSSSNSPFLQERHYEIDEEKIVGTTGDGNSSTFEIKDFVKTLRTKKYYLLYTSKAEYIYIPYDCFKSAENKEQFEREVISKIKK